MRIEEANSTASIKSFVYFPEKLYRNDPFWAPPLWTEELNAYKKKRNPVLAHSDYILLQAVGDNGIVGRSLAYVDHSFNRHNNSRIGFFGAFECIEDFEVAAALLREAEEWLRSRGMSVVRGPIHPLAECWGFLYEGFEGRPMFMAPYNPAYYNDFIARLDYSKVKDLLVYEAGAEQNYKIPQRFSNFKEKLLSQKPGLGFRRLEMKNLIADAEHIWRISNTSYRNNWGYVPVNREEFIDMVKKLKLIADPDAIWFVEDGGVPVGYALGFPDLNVILQRIRGRLLPFGFMRLLAGIKKVREYRLFGLAVLPEYQGMGLDVLLYMSLYEALSPKVVRLEANYILEDNAKIRNALEKLELKHTRTYRVYEKKLS